MINEKVHEQISTNSCKNNRNQIEEREKLNR